MNEDKLIENIKKGDMDSFEIIFNAYKDKALHTAYLITGNIHTSEDIVQETFISCFNNISKLKNTKLFKPWFFRILTRTSWKYSNKDKKAIPVEEIYESLVERDIDLSLDNFINKQRAELLYEEIDKLDIKLKTTIILYYFNELSIKEIASIMKCFEGTVKSRLFTAKRKLRQGILREGVELYE